MENEGPQRDIRVSTFWIGKTEVSWDEFEAFYAQTATEGRSDTKAPTDDIDAITGPTPPYEPPDQGWGKGDKPAITMTYFAATRYCEWLSEVTGKKYRLPTEAEWEYACRGGTATPYFFEGDPKDYAQDRLWNKIFGVDTTGIYSHVIFAQNSKGRYASPADVRPNPFGLVHMLGNVGEFCLDYYSKDTYAKYPEGQETVDPTGPVSGEEHVVRGGSYNSDAIGVRVAARDHTHHERWMLTDPQIPKSYWWYSDCKDVGFRVVCEYEGE
jgi:formylglycine-generating enzyme required for sulfatase activity